MFQAKKIVHNSIIQIIGKAINVLLGVLAISYLTRYLEPSGFGAYTTVLTFLQFVFIFLDFGLYLILLQELSKENLDKNKVFNNIVSLRIISGLSVFVIAPGIALFLPYPAIIKWGIFLTSLTFYLNGIIQVYSAVLQKEMKMHKFVLSETISKIVFFVLIIFFIKMKAGLLLILFANNIHSIIFFIMMYFHVSKYFKYKWAFDYKYIKEVLCMCWPIAVTTILNLIYFKADTLILSLYRAQEEVGLYGAPYKVLEVITTLPHMILGLVLPTFVLYFSLNKKQELNDFIQKVFDAFIVFSFMLVFIFTIEARGIIKFIAGSDYDASIPLLKILIWPAILIYFSNLFNYAIIAIGKQRKTIKYFLICAVLGLSAYLIFIPVYGYYGAAYITFFIEFLIAIFSYLLLKKYTNFKINFKIFVKVFFISILSYIILGAINIPFLLHATLACLVYIFLIIIFKIVPIDFVKELFIPSWRDKV